MRKRHEPLVFEIVGGTGFVVMTRRDDNSGRVYEGADGRTYRDSSVRLEFTDEGDSQIVSVYKGETQVGILSVCEGDYSKAYSWLQTNTHLRLLPSGSYTVEISSLVATVTRK